MTTRKYLKIAIIVAICGLVFFVSAAIYHTNTTEQSQTDITEIITKGR